jgi:hypothetical protein
MSKGVLKREKEFQKMIQRCCISSKKRKNSESAKDWFKKYYKDFSTSSIKKMKLVKDPLSCCVKTIESSKWKKDVSEKEIEAQKEIDRKRLQVAPAYNKGGYQYITSKQLVIGIYKKGG